MQIAIVLSSGIVLLNVLGACGSSGVDSHPSTDGGVVEDVGQTQGSDGSGTKACAQPSGWSTASGLWALPFALAGTDDAASQPTTQYHTLLDMDGDGRPDLLVHRDEREDPDPLVGKAYWLVFKNNEKGFDTSPMQWRLPFSLGGSMGAANEPANGLHALMDIDGDGRPDFVVYRDSEREDPDPLVGRAYWLVFKNNGQGFDAEARTWRIPYDLGGSQGPANQPATSFHALLDLDGDRRPDFLVHREGERPDVDPLVAKNHWLVFKNTGSGFDLKAMPWRIPYDLSLFEASQPSSQGHDLLDMDGDGRPDFLVRRDIERPSGDPLVGKNHWLVFSNTGSSFASEGAIWRLPYDLGGNAGAFNELSTQGHSVMDLNGDGRPDFLVTRDIERRDPDPLVGKHHWIIFSNTKSAFDLEGTTWTIPYDLGGSLSVKSQPATSFHALLDLNGDGMPDFLVHRNGEDETSDPLMGKSYWWLFQDHCYDQE
ncbi:MAG: VCBS repeat-containing protein [Deltaproteobacteria bacterium]|nr:VCBS repeat-containing protein [Deltaproteobacteria bacterium]